MTLNHNFQFDTAHGFPATAGSPQQALSPSPEQSAPAPIQSNELTSILSQLQPHVVMKVSSSEPRDALQLERTCLVFVRFASTLFFTAIGMALNFRFKTSPGASEGDENPDTRTPTQTLYSKVISFLLIILSLAVLLVSGVSYFRTINRYAKRKIRNYGFNNFTAMVCISSVVLTLMGISITLLIEGYLEDES